MSRTIVAAGSGLMNLYRVSASMVNHAQPGLYAAAAAFAKEYS